MSGNTRHKTENNKEVGKIVKIMLYAVQGVLLIMLTIFFVLSVLRERKTDDETDRSQTETDGRGRKLKYAAALIIGYFLVVASEAAAWLVYLLKFSATDVSMVYATLFFIFCFVTTTVIARLIAIHVRDHIE